MKSFKFILLALFCLAFEAGFSQVARAGVALPAAGPALNKGQVKAFIVNGDVQIQDASGKKALTRGATFEEGSTIFTGANGNALLVFSNGAAMKVLPNSQVGVV